MLIAQPHPDCTIVHEGRYVRAHVGNGSAEETQECYESAASLVLHHRFERALIVGVGHGDPVRHLAARDVVIALHEAGVPAGFKLAFVPHSEPTLNGFKHAEAEAKMRGLRVQVFDEEEDAVLWLTEPERH